MKYGRNGLSMKYGLLSTKCIAYSATGDKKVLNVSTEIQVLLFCVLDVPSDKEREKKLRCIQAIKTFGCGSGDIFQHNYPHLNLLHAPPC